jgi:uncharacterized metal-binding protein YceD (DUF177 family)
MDTVKQFLIPFSGLKEEIHEFDFGLNKTFFDYFESDLINDASLEVHLIMDKQSRHIETELKIQGHININCDRCLDAFNYPIDLDRKLFFKFGHEADEQSDDVFILHENEFQLDLAPHVYEFVVLEIPIRKEHPQDKEGNDTCNPEFLERINDLSSRSAIDPRWEALSDLKNKSYGTSKKENL